LAIAGCSTNPTVVCRASYTYEWKGFASSFVVLQCINIVLLAKEGLTGPGVSEVFCFCFCFGFCVLV